MMRLIFTISVLYMPTNVWAAEGLKAQIQKLAAEDEYAVAMKPMSFAEAARHRPDQGGVPTTIEGEVEAILGDVVLMLRPTDEGSSSTRIPAILTDPKETEQQASFLVGDPVEVTGVLAAFDRDAALQVITSDLKNVDLSAYNNEPVVYVTRLISLPAPQGTQGQQTLAEQRMPAEPQTGPQAAPAPQATAAQPTAAETAAEGQDAATPAAEPEPEQTPDETPENAQPEVAPTV